MTVAPSSRRETTLVALAWMVHALTASGAVLAFLAFLATERGDWRTAMVWLLAALIVDGIDGPLARLVDVRRRVPRVSGATLDLLVDYLTYVLLPAILIVREGLVPAGFALVAVTLILLSSLYHFARTDSKSVDNYFVGFPAVWNVVVFYLLMLRPAPIVGAIVVSVFAVLTFAPVYFVHPVRVRAFQPWLRLVLVPWALASLALLLPIWGQGARLTWLVLSLASLAPLLAVSLVRTLRGPTAADD